MNPAESILRLISESEARANAATLRCPNCLDVGWYMVADSDCEPTPVQCEFCYTEPDSVFNRTRTDVPRLTEALRALIYFAEEASNEVHVNHCPTPLAIRAKHTLSRALSILGDPK
jgi:hypothetical protein